MIHARPQNHARSREEFLTAHHELTHASDAVAKAGRTLFQRVLDGRNYAHVADRSEALVTDRDRVFDDLTAIKSLLDGLRSDVAEAAFT